jgi:aspartate kinase
LSIGPPRFFYPQGQERWKLKGPSWQNGGARGGSPAAGRRRLKRECRASVKEKPMGHVVCKFGGSSVSQAEQIRKVESIIRSDERRRFIVVSAPGKRHDEDEKITDLLYRCQALAATGASFSGPFSAIRERYLRIERELRAPAGMERLLGEVERQIAGGASPALAASRGEYLCARLLSSYLGASFLDAAKAVRIRPDGSVDEASYPALAGRLGAQGLYVLPGFYGADETGRIRTFSRGGSDVSGAVVARAVGAERYENWTDVSGVLMADPRLVSAPRVVDRITYREIRELSYMGAGVFHEEAIFPLYRQKIPINIRNTNRPDDPGTTIAAERDGGDRVVAGIAGRKAKALIYLERFLLERQPEFGRIFSGILEANALPSRSLRVGIDSAAIVVDARRLAGKEGQLRRRIQAEIAPDYMLIKPNLAEIAVVGEGLSESPGVGKRLFACLADAGVNVLLTDQGASRISAILVVEEKDFETAVQALYSCFSRT